MACPTFAVPTLRHSATVIPVHDFHPPEVRVSRTTPRGRLALAWPAVCLLVLAGCTSNGGAVAPTGTPTPSPSAAAQPPTPAPAPSQVQLVGAPQVYVRGPFVMEGILQGGAGALVALLALAAAFFFLRGHYLAPLASTVNLDAVRFLPMELSVGLVAGGMLVGCVGGLVAAWNR